MNDSSTHASNSLDTQAAGNEPGELRLRLWPGVLLDRGLWAMHIATTGEPSPTKFFTGLIIAPMVVTLLILWWALASRLRWADRGWTIGVLVALAAVTALVSRKTFPGLALMLYGLPVLASVWVGWLVVTYPFNWPLRRAGLLTLFALLAVGFSLLRVDGMDGSFHATITPRWRATAEDKLLAELKRSPQAPAANAAADAFWPRRSNCSPAIGPAFAARRATAG